MTRALHLLNRFSRPFFVSICLAACLVLAHAQSGPAVSPRERLDQALSGMDLPQALAAYDDAVQGEGPSRDLLVGIAEANLRYCLKEGRGWTQTNAARALAARRDPSGQKALVQALEVDSSQIRSQVAVWIAENSLLEAGPALRRIAGDPAKPAHERLQAARALLRLGDAEAAAETATSLWAHERADLRGAAAEIFGRIGGEGPEKMLRHGLGDPEALVMLESARGLGRMGVAAGPARLKKLLSDEKPEIRVQAAWYLASLGDRSGAKTVRAVVQAHREEAPGSPKRSSRTVHVLSWVEKDGALDVLLAIAAMEDWPSGSLEAAVRLAELGHERALPALEALYTESVDKPRRTSMRLRIVRQAGHLASSPELSAFARLASADPAPQVVRAAFELRAARADVTVLPDLRRLLGSADLGKRVWAAEAVLDFGLGRTPVKDPFQVQ